METEGSTNASAPGVPTEEPKNTASPPPYVMETLDNGVTTGSGNEYIGSMSNAELEEYQNAASLTLHVMETLHEEANLDQGLEEKSLVLDVQTKGHQTTDSSTPVTSESHHDGVSPNNIEEDSSGTEQPASNGSHETQNSQEETPVEPAPAASKEEKKSKYSSKAEYKTGIKHFIRIFSYSTWGDRLLLLAACIASICTGITLPLMNIVFGRLIGAFGGFYNPWSGETKAMFVHIVNQNVLYMVYLFAARLVLDYVAILGFRMVSLRISAAMRLEYLKALFSQPISVLDTLPPGQTAAIITITASILQIGISERMSMLIQSFSLVITATIISFLYSWSLTLVTSSGLLFIALFYSVTVPFIVKMVKEVEHSDRMASATASEVIGSIRMVAACGAESKMAKRYAGWVEESGRRGLKMSTMVGIQQSPVFFAIYATFALSFWWAIHLYMEWKITSVQTLIVVLMSVMTIVTSIGSIAAPIQAAARSAGAASVLFTIIDAPKPEIRGVKGSNADQEPETEPGDITSVQEHKSQPPSEYSTAKITPETPEPYDTEKFNSSKLSISSKPTVDNKGFKAEQGSEAEADKTGGALYANSSQPLSGEVTGQITPEISDSHNPEKLDGSRLSIDLKPTVDINNHSEAQDSESGPPLPPVSAQEDIILDSVNFAYPIRADVKILDNLSITFPAGKLTAIVGPSGSGKSTIVGLLERWYELDGNWTTNISTLFFRNGSITTGGRHLHDIDLKWWRSQIGLVQQEPFLFNDTIFKNVEYGLTGTRWENETAEKKKELVEQACKEAFADEFIARLPEGYDTEVGDAGIKLSGGQRQRLAIARSIIKQPKILILDEATSAIDVRGEKIVQAALDKVSKGRTTITIAHRLSTIKKADNIVVLQKGKAVQQGTHEELLAQKDGVYWGLANAQHLSMEDDLFSDIFDPLDKLSPDAFLNEDSVTDIQPVTNNDEPEYKEIGFIRIFALMLYEQSPQWPWYLIMLLASVGAGASYPMQAFLFAKLISVFNFWGWYLKEQTNFWCLMFVALAAGVGVSYFSLGFSSNTVSFRITTTYRKEYFENILAKQVSYFDAEDHSVGAMTARMANDPTQLQQLLGINMAFVLISVFNVVGCIAISFYFGWKLTLFTVISSLPIILTAGFLRIRYETQLEKMNYEVFAESAKFATESIGAFRTVTALTLEDTITGRYEKLLQNHIKNAFGKARFSTLIFAMSDSISLLCMAFVLWYGGKLLSNYEYMPFNYLVVYIAVVQGSIGAGQWLSFGPNIAQASAAANRIRSMRYREQDEEGGAPLNLEDLEKSDAGVKIELENVWFKYPTRDVPVLNGINMVIEKGQFAAIVGPSGSGKTSIISLLERFYNIQEGRILYNGTDISEVSLKDYRQSISLVAQEATLFEGTIRENILLGVDEDTTSEEALQQACRDSEIHDFISSLPEGYDTEVGTKGVALSGGQKQRIAIARALIRNPRVLLLDEATSNLDSETEKSVQSVFERTGKGRTMIVVAHRLATIQNADVIFVMGDVAETSSKEIPTRRGYNGSCHCGHIRYIAFMTLPPPLIDAKPVPKSSTVRLRKCNCSTCHKMSFFHVRLMNSPKDFLLLSPLSPSTELSDYTCFDHIVHWYFCGKCGVRCFAFTGEGELREAEVEGKSRKVWSPKAEGWSEEAGGGSYLSVNAATLEPKQEGLDLKEWTEKGWIAYLDTLDETGENRLKEPHIGGMY